MYRFFIYFCQEIKIIVKNLAHQDKYKSHIDYTRWAKIRGTIGKKVSLRFKINRNNTVNIFLRRPRFLRKKILKVNRIRVQLIDI